MADVGKSAGDIVSVSFDLNHRKRDRHHLVLTTFTQQMALLQTT